MKMNIKTCDHIEKNHKYKSKILTSMVSFSIRETNTCEFRYRDIIMHPKRESYQEKSL